MNTVKRWLSKLLSSELLTENEERRYNEVPDYPRLLLEERTAMAQLLRTPFEIDEYAYSFIADPDDVYKAVDELIEKHAEALYDRVLVLSLKRRARDVEDYQL